MIKATKDQRKHFCIQSLSLVAWHLRVNEIEHELNLCCAISIKCSILFYYIVFQLFTDYGKLMKDDAGKPFQVLEFLLRDWMNPYEYPYGELGGELYLANKLKVVK